MAVELSLWALDEEKKRFIRFSLQKRTSTWAEIRDLPSQNIPEDFYLYKSHSYESKQKQKNTPLQISLQEDKSRNLVRATKVKEQLLLDAYSKQLQCIEAIYLKVMIEEDKLIFEDSTSHYEKDLFLSLPDETLVALYWH